jgi:hypothetical protein
MERVGRSRAALGSPKLRLCGGPVRASETPTEFDTRYSEQRNTSFGAGDVWLLAKCADVQSLMSNRSPESFAEAAPGALAAFANVVAHT